ncbi:hypothetical protein OUHCRE21_44940 [Enterobacter hormaechei subsp. xiangfangensis]
MKACSDDYVVINEYSKGDAAWIQRVDTDEKRKALYKSSWEIAVISLAIVREYGSRRVGNDHNNP